MLWLWIGIIQYELDSRGTTPLNSNTKKREGKTLASFWQRRFPFWRKIKPLIPVLVTKCFSPAMKTRVLFNIYDFGLPAFLSHCIYSHVCCCFSCLRYVFESRTLMMHEILVFGHWKPAIHLNNEAVLESILLFFRHQWLISTHRHLFFKFVYCSTRRKSFVLCYTSFTRIQELPPTLQPSLIWNEMCTWWPWSHVKSNIPFMGHFKHVILSRR